MTIAERRQPVEANQTDTDKQPGGEQPEPELLETEWIIRRPKRAKLTAEESIRRTEEFVEKRKEQFIASIRKSKG